MVGFWIGLVAVVGGTVLAGRYFGNRPRRFRYEGETYVRHPDGTFTGSGGAPVLSPQLERVKEHWDDSHSSSGSDSSSGGGDSGGGDGGGGD